MQLRTDSLLIISWRICPFMLAGTDSVKVHFAVVSNFHCGPFAGARLLQQCSILAVAFPPMAAPQQALGVHVMRSHGS